MRRRCLTGTEAEQTSTGVYRSADSSCTRVPAAIQARASPRHCANIGCVWPDSLGRGHPGSCGIARDATWCGVEWVSWLLTSEFAQLTIVATVAELRAQKQLPELQVFVIDVVSSDASRILGLDIDAGSLVASKLSSTAIRQWIADHNQHANSI